MRIKLMHPAARIPTLGSDGAAAYDCYADDGAILRPGEQKKISLGFSAEIPLNHVGMLVPRSGTGSRGMHLANVIGILDPDYRGEAIANIRNNGEEFMTIKPGDRICQLLIVPVQTPTIEVVSELSDTARGAGSFGSTGVR